jgi:EAL domain-containing protein (putative c-di-GMP-specific phosphodiesterase class I)
MTESSDRGVFSYRDEEYEIYVQPIVEADVQGGYTPKSGEALLRYRHSHETPIAMIREAQRDGSIHELTSNVVHAVVASFADLPHALPIACNVSAPEITQAFIDTVGVIQHELHRTHHNPQLLTFELSEEHAITEDHLHLLQQLHTMGVPLALDDFGTGFANVETLRLLYGAGVPVKVKLDITLAQDHSIVEVARMLKREFDADLVAEGVTEAQIPLLREIAHLQSFVTGRAVPLNEWCERMRSMV